MNPGLVEVSSSFRFFELLTFTAVAAVVVAAAAFSAAFLNLLGFKLGYYS